MRQPLIGPRLIGASSLRFLLKRLPDDAQVYIYGRLDFLHPGETLPRKATVHMHTGEEVGVKIPIDEPPHRYVENISREGVWDNDNVYYPPHNIYRVVMHAPS